MDAPTHLDAFRALLSSCLPCTNRPPALPPSPPLRPRSNDLDSLLRPASSDLENDTDAMSLHSSFGSDARARRKKKRRGMPQLCGLNLFGKPRIALESDDEDGQQQPRHPELTRSPPRVRPRYDSDAAPLPDAAIDSLARTQQPQRQEQPLRLEESPEEELSRLRAEKAARKARRRDRRERKAARQLALDSGEFEGYPGSGTGLGSDLPISPPSTTTTTPGVDDADPEDGDADMGAAVYTRSSGRRAGQSGSSSGTGTSRTSRSGSNALGLGFQRGPPSPLGQAYVSAPPPPPPPVLSSKDELAVDSTGEPASPKDDPSPSLKETSAPSDTSLDTSAAQTRTPRPKIHLPNIVSNNLPMSSPGAGPGPRTMESSPRIAANNGFPSPRLGGSSNNSSFPSPRLGGTGNGFPSPGLGLSGVGFPSPRIGVVGNGSGAGAGGGAVGFPFGPGRKGSLTAGMGVALANRGS
ncbi:hypothetical protein FRC10_010391 [Ceratobasidium sp. 414]|nr:hypothetical protein FRC10_010391 [Ceratobasidium sp. 414]